MKSNTKIIIGIALPLIVVLVVILLAVVPKMMFQPKYSFIYATGGSCGGEIRYSSICSGQYYNGQAGWYPYRVENNKIVKDLNFPIVPVYDESTRVTVQRPVRVVTYPTLYLYDVNKDVFSAISFEDAQKYKVTNGGSAPDGTVVVNDQYGSRGLIGEILGGGSQRGYYLKNGAFTKKIEVQNATQDYYTRDFQLLGWITN